MRRCLVDGGCKGQDVQNPKQQRMLLLPDQLICVAEVKCSEARPGHELGAFLINTRSSFYLHLSRIFGSLI